MAVDHSRNEKVAPADDLAESYAILLNQRVDPISSEIRAAVRQCALDREGEANDDPLAFMSGIKLAF